MLLQLREKVNAFMYGRTGLDKLNLALLVVYLLLGIVNTFVNSWILWLASLAFLVLAVLRLLSKDTYRRGVENQKYLALRQSVVEFVKLTVRRVKEGKTHRFRKCPSCKKTLRLPNVKGRHTAHCPCCGNDFKVNIRI